MTQPSSCILLLADRSEQVHQALNKALLLARHIGAPLELFLCDTESYSRFHPRDELKDERVRAARVESGQEYLQALCRSISTTDVQIGSEAICASSMRPALADKLQRTPAQIIVKALKSAKPFPSQAGAVDWRLLEQCNAPLLLTRARPWRALPRFAAAIDLSELGDAATRCEIVQLGEALARGCDAELEYLFADAPPAQGDQALEAQRRLDGLAGAGGARGRLLYWSEEPAKVLPRVVAERDYDLLVLGVSSHPRNAAEVDGTTHRLLQAAAGDVLFVRAAAARSDGDRGLLQSPLAWA